MPELALNSFKSYPNRKQTKHNFFYSLDCHSGEGLINPLLPELKKISSEEFEYYLNFFLKKCINVNRSFSDAVEFLSIWLEKSPCTLLSALKNSELKPFFNRTEYDHEGDKWHFSKLLKIFLPLVKERLAAADEILDYLFETFDFFNMPEIFVSEVIGYDRLNKCIEECPAVFKQALILKMHGFVEENKMIDIGLSSRKYLNSEIQDPETQEAITRIKKEKKIDQQKLALDIAHTIFNYRSNKSFKVFHESESHILSTPFLSANQRGGF